MRLIDADDLKENHMYFDECYGISYAQEFDIDGCPTVDAVEIVRCKDCKFYHKADRGHPDTEWCRRLICGTIKPDFYCADGERRSE